MRQEEISENMAELNSIIKKMDIIAIFLTASSKNCGMNFPLKLTRDIHQERPHPGTQNAP